MTQNATTWAGAIAQHYERPARLARRERHGMPWHLAVIGGLSNPAKMPCLSWSTPAHYCKVGGKLQLVEGSVCFGCYALKGMYQFPNVIAAMERRYDILQRVLNSPGFAERWLDSFCWVLTHKESSTRLRIQRGQKVGQDGRFFRWHDSGDIHSAHHLWLICRIALRCPTINFWLPTREKGFVKQYLREHVIPKNLNVRLSYPMVDEGLPMMQLWAESTPGLSVSGVHTERRYVKHLGAVSCIAYTQDGECRDCRDCWNENRSYISYPLH